MATRFTIFVGDDPARTSVITFDLEKIVIGRGSVCDLRLPHPTVSLHHATLEVDGERQTIRDESSTNGTIVNGKRIVPGVRHRVRSDDVIEIGRFSLIPALSVPMEGTHSERRTEELALSLMQGVVGEMEVARLVVTQGPDEGAVLELGPPGRDAFVVGAGEGCDLRLDPGSDVRLTLERSVKGWSLSASGGAVELNGERVRSGRLGGGGTLVVGADTLELRDPLSEYQSLLLREREDVPLDHTGQERRTGAVEERPPESDADAGRDEVVEEEPLDEEVSSRSEPLVRRSSAGHMPEYSWTVITIGVLAFLGSLALLLLLMF